MNNILAEAGAQNQENKSLISVVNYLNHPQQNNYYDAETPKLRGEEPKNNGDNFGVTQEKQR